MYLPYFIVFIEVTRPWRHGLFPGTWSPRSSVHFRLLKAMLWSSQSLQWTHLSLLCDDGWSLAKCILVFMVTGILTLMLRTAVIRSQPATMRRRCWSYCRQLFFWAKQTPPGHSSCEGQCIGEISPWFKYDKLSDTVLFLFLSTDSCPHLAHRGCEATCSSVAFICSCPAEEGIVVISIS